MSALVGKHFKTNEMAEQLGISAETLRRAAMRGELKAYRIGHDLIWEETEVRSWLDRNQAYSQAIPLRRQDRASTNRRTA